MALRVIVEVEGRDYRVIHAKRVEMPAPERPTAAAIAPQGIYAELRNERDEPLYQASLSTQLGGGMEVFSPEGSARRVNAGDGKQTVMLVLPDEADATSLVFLQAPGPRDRDVRRIGTEALAEPEELARFALPTGADE